MIESFKATWSKSSVARSTNFFVLAEMMTVVRPNTRVTHCRVFRKNMGVWYYEYQAGTDISSLFNAYTRPRAHDNINLHWNPAQSFGGSNFYNAWINDRLDRLAESIYVADNPEGSCILVKDDQPVFEIINHPETIQGSIISGTDSLSWPENWRDPYLN